MTRLEQLKDLRQSFEDAISGKADIHDWTAKALTLVSDGMDQIEIKIAAQGIAASGTNCGLRSTRASSIRAALARALHQEQQQPAVQSFQQTTLLPLNNRPTKQPKISKTESGLIWIYYHSDAPTLLKLCAILIAFFGLGFAAAQSQFFVKLWDLIRVSFLNQ